MKFFPLRKKFTTEKAFCASLTSKYDNYHEDFESWIKTARPGDRHEYLIMEADGLRSGMTRAQIFLTKGEGDEITGRAESKRHKGVDIFRIGRNESGRTRYKGDFLITDLIPSAKKSFANYPEKLAELRETLTEHRDEGFEDDDLTEVLDWLWSAAYNCLGWGC